MNHLINKAKEKGFDEYHSHIYWMEGFEHSDYLWMCLLQKWLRDEHGIEVLTAFDVGHYDWEICKKSDPNFFWESEHKYDHFKTYEQALEEALIKSLTLIS